MNLKNKKQNLILNDAGFLAADFLFSFVLIIGCGIIIFALTFSLATVEIAQYITWSAARSYSAGNKSEAASKSAADQKFLNLSKKYPLLTGADGSNAWFQLTKKSVGDGAADGMAGLADKNNRSGGGTENRQPWTGVNAELEWKLFKSIQVPFLGKIAEPGSDAFTIPIRAFLLRNPSQEECLQFYSERYEKGIKGLEGGWVGLPPATGYVPIEDNGC
jgi:hypothetical protein